MPFNAGDLKWGEATLGTPSGTITWSADYVTDLNYGGSFTASDFDTALMAAFDAWESVARIDFQMVSSAGASDVDILTGSTGGAAGIAQYTYDGNPGLSSILSGSVTFSSDVTWSPFGGSGGADFHAVALHEIGHILGLGHVSDTSEIMNSVIYADALGSGDIAGAQYLYGRDASDAPPPEGEGPEEPTSPGVSSGGGGGGAGAGLLIGLLAAIIGLIFGGGAAAGAALAIGRLPSVGDDEDADADHDHSHDLDSVGVTEAAHGAYLAELPLPSVPFEDAPSPCGCYGPCDCLTDQAQGVEFLI